jgi:hypothetical protein
MSTLTSGKIAEVLLEKAVETYEHQMLMCELVMVEEHDPATLQNSGNVIWRPVQQHVNIQDGWDLTNKEDGIIEETYPAVLGTPKNDFTKQRIDDLRDRRFWERKGVQAGLAQATEQNKLIAEAIRDQGSIFYRSNTASGYDFIAEAQANMNERQGVNNGRCFVLNDRDQLKFSKDLASRENLTGRPENTWKTGQIGADVAQFDVFTGSFLPNLTGGADPATTVTGNQSFKPESGSVNPTTKVVTNVDYREAEIPVADSSGYNIGDKVTFSNGGTPVESIGLADKAESGQAMTFTIVDKPDATTITVYPKPIAADDPALSDLEKAYANIDTRILNAATVDRKNTDASAKTNLFWDKGAVEVMAGEIPADLFAELDGMKTIKQTMKGGVTMYMIYDGNIEDMTFRYRLFAWYGITVANPSNCGVAVTFT